MFIAVFWVFFIRYNADINRSKYSAMCQNEPVKKLHTCVRLYVCIHTYISMHIYGFNLQLTKQCVTVCFLYNFKKKNKFCGYLFNFSVRDKASQFDRKAARLTLLRPRLELAGALALFHSLPYTHTPLPVLSNNNSHICVWFWIFWLTF